jgi:hypothetical protein
MGSVTIGLDANRKGEFTTIAVADREDRRATNGESEVHHVVGHLERLSEGSYPNVPARVAEIVNGVPRPTGRYSYLHRLFLYVNVTDVGTPVLDVLEHAGVRAHLVPAFLTEGHERDESEKEDEVRLGRGWLVSRLQALFETGRLHLPRTPEAEELKRELLEYEETGDRSGSLVTALGLAVQVDQRGGRIYRVRTFGGSGGESPYRNPRADRTIREALDRLSWSSEL